jgi:Ca2+-binding EF-hand superfamily protein
LVAALDANHDGVIDATEIANAAGALKALDKNGDGQLTRDELRSPMPGGTNGFAGPRPGGPQGPGEHRPPMPPLIAALDANHDGVVDAKEIANASKSLKALDENADGKLTRDEFGPRWPVRPPGAGTGDGNQDGPPHHHGGGPPPGQE